MEVYPEKMDGTRVLSIFRVVPPSTEELLQLFLESFVLYVL